MAENKKVTTLQDIADILFEMNVQFEERFLNLNNVLESFIKSTNKRIKTLEKAYQDLEGRVRNIEENIKISA